MNFFREWEKNWYYVQSQLNLFILVVCFYCILSLDKSLEISHSFRVLLFKYFQFEFLWLSVDSGIIYSCLVAASLNILRLRLCFSWICGRRYYFLNCLILQIYRWVLGEKEVCFCGRMLRRIVEFSSTERVTCFF